MIKRLDRTEYLQKLIYFKDKQLIKVITGVRRCGKSTLLEIFQDYLKANGADANQILTINLEDFDFFALRNPESLHSYIKNRLLPDKMTYVFIDEIQHCTEFPAVIDSLYIRNNVDIYLTGSNAYMLSGEIATLLSGRYIEIKMLPLSFKEYVKATDGGTNLSRSYRNYIRHGSFPYTLALGNNEVAIREYLEGIYNTIVVKDIATRKKISDTMMLESVTRFLFSSAGSPVSTKKIADTMTSAGRKTDVKTIERYLDGLMESYIVYQAKRFNIRGKQYLKTLEKYYAVDTGLRYLLLGSSGTDVGHILENIVYLELLRRGFSVYVGKLDELEVDFVAKNQNGLQYIQVAASVRDDKTLQRELTSLQRISDNYPKLILTLDD
ncbi:MAG: ATP-binding protein, partial [Acidaminococcaceae bacterium]|nr:ATP-binding protein [Acidaminococcaceae bacterium]